MILKSKFLLLLIIALSWSLPCFAQKYKITGISGSASDGASGCNGSSFSSFIRNSSENGLTENSVITFWNNKPTEIVITSTSETSDGQCNNVVVVCADNPIISLNLNDCETYSYFYNGCYSGFISFTIEPIINPPSGPSTGITYCSTSSISLTATNGFNSYKWEYSISTSSGFQPLRTTTVNSTSIQYSDLSGIGFNQNVYFRYTVGNCSSVYSNVVGAYKFAPNPLKALVPSVTKSEITCIGSANGSITIPVASSSFDRNLISGETIVSTSLYTQPNSSPAFFYKSNSGNSISGIAPSTYYILVESNIIPCSVASFSAAITFSDPPPFPQAEL